MKTRSIGPSECNFPEHVENWNEYFLCMAETAALKSKDPKCRVGAVIASSENIVLSTGFNGLARKVYDNAQLLADPEEKLKVICHAEFNAICNAARIGVRLEGASIFVNKFPCLACCNAIIQAGIVRVYTHDNRFWDDDPADSDHSRKIAVLKQAGITVDAPFHPQFLPHGPISLKRQPSVPEKKAPSRARRATILPPAEESRQPDLFARKR
jgi:dCMP deaminase